MKILASTIGRTDIPACGVFVLDAETIGMIQALSMYSVLHGHKAIKLRLPAECRATWYDSLHPRDEAPFDPFDYAGAKDIGVLAESDETRMTRPQPSTEIEIIGDEVHFHGVMKTADGNEISFNTQTVYSLPGEQNGTKGESGLKLAA